MGQAQPFNPNRLARARAARPNLKLSVLMPVFDEEDTVEAAVTDVLAQSYPCPMELVVVDDGSRIPVAESIAHIRDPRLRLHRHETNLGKGAALRHAAALATGTHICPFDADLEYDAADLPVLLAPVLAGRTDVVYGTRLFGANTRYQSYRHGLANRFLTLAASIAFDACISDLHTCLKLMPLSTFRSFMLRESGFGLDTEITARILAAGVRPFEVPISYHSRSKADGKKITWRDGLDCLLIIARVRARTRALPLPDRSRPGAAAHVQATASIAHPGPFRRRPRKMQILAEHRQQRQATAGR